MSNREKELISLLLLLVAMPSMVFIGASKDTDNATPMFSFGPYPGYDFNRPDNMVQLPKILHEISGLTDIDQHRLALVQDEDGIIFIYDCQKEEIVKQIKFGESGDYEGVTRVGNDIYVLRSDGKLFEIKNFESEDFKVKEHSTGIPVKNSEGLGYDVKRNRILIAGKSRPNGDEYSRKKAVFAFDLKKMSLDRQPVYTFKIEDIERFIEVHRSNLEIVQNLNINPSAIAVHPITDRLFVLSSKDQLVYIFDQKSKLESVYQLDRKIHSQPEGITFLDNGEMFISNEGADQKPTLLHYDFRR